MTVIKVFKIILHTVAATLLITSQVAYWNQAVAHPVHAHVIFWLAWAGVLGLETVMVIKDLRA